MVVRTGNVPYNLSNANGFRVALGHYCSSHIPEMSAISDASFEEKLQLLKTIIEKGLEKLLSKAETDDILLPPFGRKPEPTPLISEDHWEVI